MKRLLLLIILTSCGPGPLTELEYVENNNPTQNLVEISNNEISIGDIVGIIPGNKFYKLYKKCKKITAIGLQAVQEANHVWLLLEGCEKLPRHEQITTDIVSLKYLTKELEKE